MGVSILSIPFRRGKVPLILAVLLFSNSIPNNNIKNNPPKKEKEVQSNKLSSNSSLWFRSNPTQKGEREKPQLKD